MTITVNHLPPQAPLQRLTADFKKDVAQYLTFTEAVSWMLTAKDVHTALQDNPHRPDDPRLLFHKFREELGVLGCNDLCAEISGIDTEILKARWQPASKPSLWPPKEKKKQDAARAHEREQEARKTELVAELGGLERNIEEAVFDVSARRRTYQSKFLMAHEPSTGEDGRLHEAIANGDVDMVRTGLREFLSLPPRLLSSTRMVAWLRQPMGMCSLKYFGQYRCDLSLESERKQYEAITAYVDEIVRSVRLLPAEKAQLCIKLERTHKYEVFPPPDTLEYGISHRNPAFSASILLGILESGTESELQRYLLGNYCGDQNGKLIKFVQKLTQLLGCYDPASHDDDAQRWINDLTARLQKWELALEAP